VTEPVADVQDEHDELLCPACGYDVRGIASERCPECGGALDRERMRQSRLPWTFRRDIGRVRAYVRTVAMVIRDPLAVADEVARPVSFDDARKFRLVTVLIAWLVPAVMLAWLWTQVTRMPPPSPRMPFMGTPAPQPPANPAAPASSLVAVGWALQYALLPVAWGAVWLFLVCAAGVASYFFHPPHLSVARQNRAVAVSYYGCAPLALTPLSAAGIGLILLLDHLKWTSDGRLGVVAALVYLAALVPAIVQLVASFTSPMRMLRRATHCSATRLWTMGIVLPTAWAILATVVAIGIPAAYIYVAIIVLSLG
jgi:hypothetical protein